MREGGLDGLPLQLQVPFVFYNKAVLRSFASF